MSAESLRNEQHISERGQICPNCGTKDSIIYWKSEGSNVDLFGNKRENMIRIKPRCTRCGKEFSKGTMFRTAR